MLGRAAVAMWWDVAAETQPEWETAAAERVDRLGYCLTGKETP